VTPNDGPGAELGNALVIAVAFLLAFGWHEAKRAHRALDRWLDRKLAERRRSNVIDLDSRRQGHVRVTRGDVA
jgi:hypothetical protein